MWETVLLKKSSNYKTLLSWWARWSRPDNEKPQSFKDIWISKEEIDENTRTRQLPFYVNQIESDIYRIVKEITELSYDENYRGESPNINLASVSYIMDNLRFHLKDYFYMYDRMGDRNKVYFDNRANNIWKFYVDRIKRKHYPSMATDRTKERRLKQLIPDEFINEFSEQDLKNIHAALSSPRQNRAMKNMLQMLSGYSDPEFKQEMIQMIKQVGRS